MENLIIGPDVIISLVSEQVRVLNKTRDDQLIKRLKEFGYEFDTKIELHHFLKTRCRLEQYHNKLNMFYADEKLIAEWWDTFRYEIRNGKTIAIMGESPSEIARKPNLKDC